MISREPEVSKDRPHAVLLTTERERERERQRQRERMLEHAHPLEGAGTHAPAAEGLRWR